MKLREHLIWLLSGIVVTLLALYVATSVPAQPRVRLVNHVYIGDVTPRNAFEVVIDHVHDADTVSGTILFPWKVSLGPQLIRASNYDAWELTKTRESGRKRIPIPPEEIEKGKVAKAYFESLLAKPGAKFYVVPKDDGKRDGYGRPLGEYWLNTGSEWQDVGMLMRDGGHVRIAQ